jgi:hypothetical protein
MKSYEKGIKADSFCMSRMYGPSLRIKILAIGYAFFTSFTAHLIKRPKEGMKTLLRAATLVICTALAPAFPAQSSSAELSRKDLQRAEATAKTSEDHLRLAQYYRAKAAENQRKLAEAEDLVEYWGRKSWMVYRNKIPNPYQSAKARVDYYRREVQAASRLASAHERAAEELRSH